jgi:serine/threonine-protein kinase
LAVFICQACGAEHSNEGGKCPECGATQTIRLQAVTDRMVGRVIKGKYKIVRKLGQGGMGAVYLSEQLGIGHQVALKFLKSEFSSDAEIARRFLNEAKSYARVAHPNAVTLYDFGQDEEGNLFIAMEYCEGSDLKKVIAEQKQLPIAEALEVVLQVADVLANAHVKGVIHRDLKPENIMIRRGMRGVHAKVLDFGIARLMDAGTRLTVAGAIAGTPRYMSPEQVEGREADLRADIYSLGIVLYETLTGIQPFDGKTIAEILRRQVVEPMPRLAEANPDLDYAALDAVIQKATAKNREERWPDMLTFAGALSQALPTQAHLSVPALQRTGMSRVNATPTPGSATSPSGMALPGAPMTDLELNGQTLLKGSTSSVSMGLSPASTLPGGFGTQLEGRTPAAPPNTSLAPVAPTSKGPMVVGVVLAVVLIGGAVWALAGRTSTPEPSVAPPPVAAVLLPPPVVLPVEKRTGSEIQVADEGVRRLTEEAARIALGEGRTSFKLADLDAAETHLKSVESGTPSFAEAQELLGKIAKIHELLGAANGRRAKGECDSALNMYQQVLKLNSKITDAVEGSRQCLSARVGTTMDP